MNYIQYFEKRKLLTDGKSNTKTAKNKLQTYYLSLQPTNLNSAGQNLCKFSTKECRTACLQFAGRQSFDNVVQSRTKKTEFFVTQKDVFVKKLWEELIDLNGKGTQVAVRLNLLSDVNWQSAFWTVDTSYDMNILTNVQFYDYTKDHTKVELNKVKNYNLTYSFSGHNWLHVEKFLNNKIANVAVVFKNVVPSVYKGFKVVDGDSSDERFLEDKGLIIGLKYKTPKGVKYTKTKFVIDE